MYNNRVYYDDTLLGHIQLFERQLAGKEIVNPLSMIWQPEWRWTERVHSDGLLAWDYDDYDIYNDLITKSTLDELDQIVNDKFNDWQKLYEAFRRTDNVLDDWHMKLKLINEAAFCLNKPINTIHMDAVSEQWWDAFYELWKNPDNRIPVWRD